MFEVLSSQEELFNSGRQLIDAIINRAISKYRLSHATQTLLEKSTMEAHKPEKQFNYSLDELGSVVTSAMESSVAAAEFRALSFVDLDNWDVNDLETILDAKNILVKELQWIDVKRSLNQINQKQNVYLALGKDHAWVFSFDESTLKLSAPVRINL